MLTDRCRTSDFFFVRVAGVALSAVGQKERWFWKSFLMVGQVFGEHGPRFERVENLVLWNCRLLSFWTWWNFCVAGAALRANFSWQAQYLLYRPRQKSCWDLAFGIFNVHFSWCAHFFVKIKPVLAQPSCGYVHVGSLSLWRGANFAIARANLSALCVGSDRSRCGAILLLADSLWFWSGKEILWQFDSSLEGLSMTI